MPIVLITGTDTSVGKTVVTSLIIRALQQKSVKVDAVKPIETGCTERDGELFAPDAAALSEALHGTPERFVEHVLLRFKQPVAPVIASRLEETPIDTADLVRQIKSRSQNCDLLLVEGAGGILVPITEGYTYAELARDCGMSVLVVVGSRLGAGNHSALTFELRKGRSLNVMGYVFNDLHASKASEDPSISTNRALVREIGEMYRMQELGYIPELPKSSILTSSGDLAILALGERVMTLASEREARG